MTTTVDNGCKARHCAKVLFNAWRNCELSSPVQEVVEHPPAEGYKRVWWKCVCGDELFDDYRELERGAASRLAFRLDMIQSRAVPPREERSMVRSWLTAYGLIFALEAMMIVDLLGLRRYLGLTTAIYCGFSSFFQVWARYATGAVQLSNPRRRSSTDNGVSPGGEDVTPGSFPSSIRVTTVAREQGSNWRTRNRTCKRNRVSVREGLMGYQLPSPPRLFLLTCANEARDAVKLTQLGLREADIRSDEGLALLLRRHWSHLNGKWYRYFRFKGLKSIEFVRFQLHDNRFADIQKCPDVPGTTQSLEYEFDRTDLLPPLGEKYLLHLFKHPAEYADEKIAYFSIPKRKGRLEDGVGWGINMVESFQLWRLWLFCIVLLCGGALLFAVVWTERKHNMQNAFSVGAFMMVFTGFVVAFVQDYQG